MHLYRIQSGILLSHDGEYFLQENTDWDTFVNDDDLYAKLIGLSRGRAPLRDAEQLLHTELLPPIGRQEVWAAGVTYYRSKVGREEESKAAGGSDFYSRVYEADRPELFFKATPHRVVGHGGLVNIREDSTWDAPEPELTLVITSNGKIVGYTIGNDMSSRSIEGENPLYLPQAKTYDASAAIGPGIWVSEQAPPPDTLIELSILRRGEEVFGGTVTVDQIKRKLTELVGYLFRACSFPDGCLLMTGTGIVPGQDFTLEHGDEIRITIEPIGTLVNTVR